MIVHLHRLILIILQNDSTLHKLILITLQKEALRVMNFQKRLSRSNPVLLKLLSIVKY